MKAKISVIIPMYNSKKTIVETIDSIVNQTYEGMIEIIVVNDGSDDGCSKIVEKIILNNKTDLIINLINKQNNGVSSTRNIGIDKATGKYLAFLDSDDTWHPKKLEVIISLMEENKITFLGHAYTLTDNFMNIDNNKSIKKISFLQILMRNITQTSCIVIKKDICGYFNENMTHTEDHELWLRTALDYDIYYVDIPFVKLGRPQLSLGGLSGNKWAMRKGEIQMYLNIVKLKKCLILFLPFLILFSLFKHCKNGIKDFKIKIKKEQE